MLDAIIHWLKSGYWKPTFEGVATFLTAVVALIAALVAYCAVKKQIAAASSNLQKQLDAEKQARSDKQEAGKRVLAKVLVREIDFAYDIWLKPLDELTEKYSGTGNYPFTPEERALVHLAQALDLALFVVPSGRSGQLGGLDFETLGAVIRFYSISRILVTKLQADLKIQFGGIVAFADVPATRQLVARAISQGRCACRRLCETAGVDFTLLNIAKVDIGSLKEQPSKQ